MNLKNHIHFRQSAQKLPAFAVLVRVEHNMNTVYHFYDEETLYRFCNRSPYRGELLQVKPFDGKDETDGKTKTQAICFCGRDYATKARNRLVRIHELAKIHQALSPMEQTA